MKKSLIIAGILLVGSTLFAGDGYYVGFDIGNSKGKISVHQSALFYNYDRTVMDDAGSQTFKFGKYIDSNSRVSVFYQHINVDEGTGGTYGVGYDYLHGADKLKPFIGIFAGNGFLEFDNSEFEMDGMIYGVQAGLNYEITSNTSFEAGYRFSKTSMEYSKHDTFFGSDYSYKAEIDEIKNWYFGLNYKF